MCIILSSKFRPAQNPFYPWNKYKTRIPLIPKYFLRYSPELNLLRFTGPSPPAEIPICSSSEGER